MEVATLAKSKLEKRKRAIRRRKRIKNVCIICTVTIISAVIFLCIYYPFRHIDNDELVLTRNLTGNGIFIQNLPKETPTMAWYDDLPNFIQRDLRWLDKNNEYAMIKYTFGEQVIQITKDGEDYDFRINEWIHVDNASIYEEDGKLFVYGINYSEVFAQYVITETDVESSWLSLDHKHLPLDVCDLKKDVAWRVGDYALLLKNNVFYFYQNGNLISQNAFYDEIESVYTRYSMLKTTNNILYSIHIYLENDLPQITSRYIDVNAEMDFDWVDPVDLFYYDEETREATFLPIVQKYGEYYTYVPVDWEAYEKYHISQEENTRLSKLEEDTNFKWQAVKLADAFFSADIECDEIYDWQADLVFDFGTLSEPRFFEFENYQIRGFDSYYMDCLTNGEISYLSRKVFSIDKFWDAVEEIRLTYEKYYEKRGD